MFLLARANRELLVVMRFRFGDQTVIISTRDLLAREMASMTKAKLTGAMLATAVALVFAASAVQAADSASSAPAPQVKCVGGNSCKGKSACASAQNGCQGQNACKGKGYVMTSTVKQCIAAGGKPDTGKKAD